DRPVRSTVQPHEPGSPAPREPSRITKSPWTGPNGNVAVADRTGCSGWCSRHSPPDSRRRTECCRCHRCLTVDVGGWGSLSTKTHEGEHDVMLPLGVLFLKGCCSIHLSYGRAITSQQL